MLKGRGVGSPVREESLALKQLYGGACLGKHNGRHTVLSRIEHVQKTLYT